MKEVTVNSYEVKLISKRKKVKIKVIFEVDLDDLGKLPFDLFAAPNTERGWNPVSWEEYKEILEALKEADEEKSDNTSA